MLYLVVFLVCFLSSIAGAICGIGGGVIIKPVLDALGVMSVSAVSFLSGCTVLFMTTYSVFRSKIGGESKIEQKTGLPLAIGAAFGGVAGRMINKRLSEKLVNRLFIVLMVMILFINLYNIYRFTVQ